MRRQLRLLMVSWVSLARAPHQAYYRLVLLSRTTSDTHTLTLCLVRYSLSLRFSPRSGFSLVSISMIRMPT